VSRPACAAGRRPLIVVRLRAGGWGQPSGCTIRTILSNPLPDEKTGPLIGSKYTVPMMRHGKAKEEPHHQYADEIIGWLERMGVRVARNKITNVIRRAIEAERQECAEAVCEGCRESWPLEDGLHRLPHPKPWEGGPGTHTICEATPIWTRGNAINSSPLE
jgi:hypothetical protein